MSGLDHAVPQEADACPERDDAHAGAGRDLLCAVEGLALNVEVVVGRADGHSGGGVEQEQELEDRAGISDFMSFSFRAGICEVEVSCDFMGFPPGWGGECCWCWPGLGPVRWRRGLRRRWRRAW